MRPSAALHTALGFAARLRPDGRSLIAIRFTCARCGAQDTPYLDDLGPNLDDPATCSSCGHRAPLQLGGE